MVRSRHAEGFTLIELIIVISIVALLSAAAVPAVQSVTGANARSAAAQLAGASRALFDTAALRHQTCRLVLDLEESAWWAECTKDKVFVGREARSAEDLAREEEEAERELEERFPDEKDAEKRRLFARASWGEFKDKVARKRGLPGDARFVDVWAEHLREPVSKGRAYVYFWPQGRAQDARIPIVDGDNAYSVLLQAWTGRARVVNGMPEVRR